MKRSKNVRFFYTFALNMKDLNETPFQLSFSIFLQVKPLAKQRSISSFFSSASSTGPSPPKSGLSIHSPKSCSDDVEVPAILATSSQVTDVAPKKASLKLFSGTSASSEFSKTNKRKREEILSASPELIPSTPPVMSHTKDRKNTSMSLSSKKIKSNISLFDHNPNSIKNGPFKKSIQSPRGKPRSPLNSTDQTVTLKTPLISPIKTEDDEVLRSILEHISPQKTINGKPTLLKPKKSLFSVASSENVDNDEKPINCELTAHGEAFDKVNQNKLDTRGKVAITKEVIESSTKQKCKKNLQSPSTAEPPELKYPRLTVRTNSAKSKANKGVSSDVKSPCSSSQASSTTPGKITALQSPVRRSPRKHPAQPSPGIKQV